MRILVVDDDAAARESVRLMLTDFGHHADGAGDGREAIVCLEKLRYDVILTDLAMPDLDGIALCELACSLGYGGAWILMTGAHHHRRLAEARMPVLYKPFRSADLLSTVERVRASLDAGLETTGLLSGWQRPVTTDTGVRATPLGQALRKRCSQT
jgi:CheY-like chemotaxis protein